jgi:hypothetical protein
VGAVGARAAHGHTGSPYGLQGAQIAGPASAGRPGVRVMATTRSDRPIVGCG